MGVWKKYQKLIVAGGGEGVLSFSNHENYSIKNIYVFSKIKIKTKVKSKQNLEQNMLDDKSRIVYSPVL